jgi:hypothetical protein
MLLLNGSSPRTPYAVVAYTHAQARGWRERGGPRAAVSAVLFAVAALVALRAMAAPPAAVLAKPLGRGGGGGAGLTPGPPRYVLVLDSGSSGTRM